MERSDLLDRALDLLVADRSPRFIAALLDSTETEMLVVAQRLRGAALNGLSTSLLNRLRAQLSAHLRGSETTQR